MKRILLLLIEVALLVIGFMWLLRHPGHMVIDWMGYEIELAFSTFIISLTVFIAILWFSLSFVFWFLKIPFRLGDRYVRYHRKKGFEALYGALEALALSDAERFEKEAEQVDILLKEKELSLYLKGEATLLQKNYALAEQYFYELAQTKRGQVSGLMGLLRVAEAQNAKSQRWRVAQKLSEVATPSRRLQIALYESALAHGKYEFALDALKPLIRNRLADRKEVSELQVSAYLAREAELRQEKDRHGAFEAAEQAYEIQPTPYTLKRYLPHLLEEGKDRKARKLLTKLLEESYDKELFIKLCELKGKKVPLEHYQLLKLLYEQYLKEENENALGALQDLIRLAQKSELWGDARALLEKYQQSYGEDQYYFCQKAELCLAETVDFKQAISFYQQACKA